MVSLHWGGRLSISLSLPEANCCSVARISQSRIQVSCVNCVMSVVRHLSHNICVMYLGQVVEFCKTEDMFAAPLHPYTKALLSAIPSVDLDAPKKRIVMTGEITSPIDPQPGCRFAARCAYRTETCSALQKGEEILPGHFVTCCHAKEINGL